MTDIPSPDFRVAAPRPAETASRRELFSGATRLGAVGSLLAIAACESEESPLANTPTPTPSGSPTPAPTPTETPSIISVSSADTLALMLQLHYLQGEFYSRAVLDTPLPAAMIGGSGTPGEVTGPRQVSFKDPLLGELMREIAAEKIGQIIRLRAALGPAVVARPALNLAVDDAGAFTRFGRDAKDVPAAAAGAAQSRYDVYADQERLLLGAFILEDAVMTAWRGIIAQLTASAEVDVAVGLLATCAHHVGLIRTQLFLRGAITGSTLHPSANRLSDLRDSYSAEDDDQGVAVGSGASVRANIAATDADGEIFGRRPQMTINVFYMTRKVATSGGFFPAGLNGALRTSTAT